MSDGSWAGILLAAVCTLVGFAGWLGWVAGVRHGKEMILRAWRDER